LLTHVNTIPIMGNLRVSATHSHGCISLVSAVPLQYSFLSHTSLTPLLPPKPTTPHACGLTWPWAHTSLLPLPLLPGEYTPTCPHLHPHPGHSPGPLPPRPLPLHTHTPATAVPQDHHPSHPHPHAPAQPSCHPAHGMHAITATATAPQTPTHIHTVSGTIPQGPACAISNPILSCTSKVL